MMNEIKKDDKTTRRVSKNRKTDEESSKRLFTVDNRMRKQSNKRANRMI